MEMDPMKRKGGDNMEEEVESAGKLLETEKMIGGRGGEDELGEVVVDEKKSKKKKKGQQGESEARGRKKKAKASRKKRGSEPAVGDSGAMENEVMTKSASTPNSADSESRWTDGTSAGALEASEAQPDGGDGRRKKSSEGNGKGLEVGVGKVKGGELATRDEETTNVVIVETGEDDGRETWTRGADFLLSIIGFAVDLANVWRFPYLCYRNGGGAFLIPYTLMLVFGALPLFYMELILGQFNRQGPISVWRICPLFKGVGFCAVLVAFYVSFYYNVIIGWALYFLVASASAAPSSADLPWLHCNNSWNTDDCWEGVAAVTSVPPSAAPSVLSSSPHPSSSVHGGHHVHTHHSAAGAAVHASVASAAHVHAAAVQVAAETEPHHQHTPQAPVARPANSPASEYFHRAVLEMQGSGGLHDLGVPKWQLVLCVFLVYTMLYLSLFKGVKSSGKVVWATATLPYVVLSILLVRGLMLPGALSGISYYLNPELQRLGDTQVWVDAAVQIFYSVGAGFGVHLSYASYNTFHNNCLRDCLVTTAVNCFTSFFSGLVIFTYLGFMSHKQGVHISTVAAEGPGLVFQVYPEAVATLPGSHIWSMLFFFMLIMLGLDSAMGGMECVITGLMDEFKGVFHGRRFAREIFTLLAILVSFSVALMNVTPGGMYMFHLLDTYSAGISLLCSALFEALAVSWFYGLERFSADVEAMLGSKPGIYWRVCWKFISPSFIIGVVLFGLIYHQPLKYNDYAYPAWAELVGWSLALSSVLMIPIVAIITISRTPGSCKERIAYNITPIEEHDKIRREGMDGVSRFKCRHWLYV